MPPPGCEPFLRAICENPDDDTVRLVYADWLDERGDPDRAEFIRCQIACARQEHPKNPHCRRARVLLKERSAAWRSELPRLRLIDWGAFARGFVGRISVRDSPSFAADLATAFAAVPVGHVALCHCRPWMLREIVRFPLLDRVRSLEARSGYVNDEALEELAACPGVVRLEVVTLPGQVWATTPNGRERIPQVTDRGAAALARSPHLSRLRTLRLLRTHITPEGWGVLRERFWSVQQWDYGRGG